MDHIIYGDYIVNRRSFIYCSLATHVSGRLRHAVHRKSHETTEVGHFDVHLGAEDVQANVAVSHLWSTCRVITSVVALYNSSTAGRVVMTACV